MVQKKLPLINSAHGSETRNIINELIKLFNTLGYTYDEALINAHNILNEAQKTNDMNKSVQEQINTLIAESGTSDAEVLQARIDADGNEYPVLKDRLDESDAQLAQIATNVMEFGAVADANYYDEVNKKYYSDSAMTIPATDNTPAFQSAVNYLSSVGGGTIFVPKGKYCFSSSVNWKTKVSLKGDGIGNTVFFTEGDMFDLFKYIPKPSDGSAGEDSNIWLEDCKFEDFECNLEGLTRASENIHGKALFLLYMRRARFNNLLLKNTIGTALGCDFLTETVISNVVVYNAGRNWGSGAVVGAGQSGIGIGTCALEEETVLITGCHVYNCGNYGIFVETQHGTPIKSKGAKIIGCHVYGNKHGIGNKGSGATQITGCTIKDNLTYGVYLSQSSSGDLVSDNLIENNGSDGVRISSRYEGDNLIVNNRITNNKGYGIVSVADLDITRKNMVINNNTIQENDNNGIYVFGKHDNVDIKANNIINNGQMSGGRAIKVDGIVNGISLLNNSLLDTQLTQTQIVGIELYSTVTDFFLDGNSANGQVENNYILNGASGVIGENVGLEKKPTESYGSITFNPGETTLTIPHGLVKAPNTVLLTCNKNFRVWCSAVGVTNIVINRESEVGDITAYWHAKM